MLSGNAEGEDFCTLPQPVGSEEERNYISTLYMYMDMDMGDRKECEFLSGAVFTNDTLTPQCHYNLTGDPLSVYHMQKRPPQKHRLHVIRKYYSLAVHKQLVHVAISRHTQTLQARLLTYLRVRLQ